MNWSDRLGAGIFATALIIFAIFAGYVVVVYVIQGKPTQREKDRTSLGQLQQQVSSLTLRVKLLEEQK